MPVSILRVVSLPRSVIYQAIFTNLAELYDVEMLCERLLENIKTSVKRKIIRFISKALVVYTSFATGVVYGQD